MKELSLHILDIANNSVAADATLITIEVCEDIAANSLIIRIEDNGRGMSPSAFKGAGPVYYLAQDQKGRFGNTAF